MSATLCSTINSVTVVVVVVFDCFTSFATVKAISKTGHRKEAEQILPPTGFEPGTFWSEVRRSHHWAIPSPTWLVKAIVGQAELVSMINWKPAASQYGFEYTLCAPPAARGGYCAIVNKKYFTRGSLPSTPLPCLEIGVIHALARHSVIPKITHSSSESEELQPEDDFEIQQDFPDWGQDSSFMYCTLHINILFLKCWLLDDNKK